MAASKFLVPAALAAAGVYVWRNAPAYGRPAWAPEPQPTPQDEAQWAREQEQDARYEASMLRAGLCPFHDDVEEDVVLVRDDEGDMRCRRCEQPSWPSGGRRGRRGMR